MTEKKRIQVVIALIRDCNHQLFISKRARHVHQGDLWEFPGGKVEMGETIQQALYRELLEEVGIEVQESEFMMTIKHDYPEVHVELQVYWIHRFSGQAFGLEGQEFQWVKKGRLQDYSFPKANDVLIQALLES